MTHFRTLSIIAFIFSVSFVKAQDLAGVENKTSTFPTITTSSPDQKQTKTDKAFTLYPNPSEGKFKIDLEGRPLVLENTKVEVFTEDGKNVYTASYKQHEIDITKFSKGTYLIEVGDGEKKYTNKVVIQ
jgi:hypothetical protein